MSTPSSVHASTQPPSRAALGHQGLWPTLEGQAHDFMDSSELHCCWAMDIAPGLSEPEGPMAAAVFCIFQEMLSNVARHAQATEVEIRLCARPSDLTLRVKDNGRGAPPSAFNSPTAFGVMAMRERAGHFGGWLHIDSQLGQGTQLILSMPLYQAAVAPTQGPRQGRAA